VKVVPEGLSEPLSGLLLDLQPVVAKNAKARAKNVKACA